jgi:hypothetical protein
MLTVIMLDVVILDVMVPLGEEPTVQLEPKIGIIPSRFFFSTSFYTLIYKLNLGWDSQSALSLTEFL